MSDSYELAILVMVAVLLFLGLVAVGLYVHRQGWGVSFRSSSLSAHEPPFMNDRNLFRRAPTS